MSVTYTFSSTMEPTMEKQLSCYKDCRNVHDVYGSMLWQLNMAPCYAFEVTYYALKHIHKF